MTNAGKMRFRVLIERQSDTQEPSGQPVDVWTLFASRRAAIEALPGLEKFAPQQQVARVPTVWRTRYIAGVLPSMRLRFGQRLFDIVSAVDPDGTKTDMRITTLERIGESP
jgi:SPP1 family predicted phage head-tail adaptor